MFGLVADIGSTNARFALAHGMENGPPTLSRIVVLPCRDFPNLGDAARRYIAELPATELPRTGTIAVAGPVSGDVIALTNHPWRFSIEAVRHDLGFDHLSFINDFTAISLALLSLPPEGVIAIGLAANLPEARILGVIGPGTGLGVGGLLHCKTGPLALSSEGSHATFAPQTEREWTIARILTARFGHVSNERLLSGPGLENIHAALVEISGRREAPLTAEQITTHAMAGHDPLCVETLDHFFAVLGAAAGDLALLLYADAIFIAGGIVPRLVDALRASRFRKAFEAKGRYADHLSRVPTLVITDRAPGLLGAARHLFAHHTT